MRSPSSLLLTGGAGFIGSSVAEQLLADSRLQRLVILDALSYAGDRQRLRRVLPDPRVRFVHGDIRDQALLARLFEESAFSGILHLAAESHVDRSLESPLDFVSTNVLGTSCLLEAARRHQVPFLFCSTDEIYGPTPFPKKFTEIAPPRPSSPYSASKAAAEHLVLAAHCSYGQDVVIARPSNNYGPRQHPEKLIPKFITQATRDEALPLYGSGRQIRDWLHVEDCARGLIAAFLHGRPGRAYNLSAEYERTNLGLARLILKLLGKPESLISHVADRPGHDARYAIDPRLARYQLQWRPRISFLRGFKDCVREIAAHESLRQGQRP
ncbi:MAG: dTDP-glucose 4,6-dehydratase [Verrucomicrobiales bacterium]